MHVLPVTKFPCLDSIEHAGRTRGASAATTLSRRYELGAAPWYAVDADALLARYAAFVAAFSGDDDVSFAFAVLGQPLHGQPPPSPASGAAHMQPPAPLTKTHGGSDSDFGIVVALDAADAPPLDEALGLVASKPCVVVVDAAGVSLRTAAGLIPAALADSLLATLVSYLGAAAPAARIPEYPSVLNHPPQVEPPDYEAVLGLPAGASGPDRLLLHAPFSFRCRDHPDRPAIDFKGPAGRVVYTYRQVEALSDALARHLRSLLRGKPSRHVAVLLDPSPELYMAWLGVLKAGCAFCPLPIETPAEPLSGLLDELASRVVLTASRVQSSLEGAVALLAGAASSPPPTTVDLASFIEGGGLPPPDDHDPLSADTATTISPDDVAYIMYTSGSTGRPKGVQITHRAGCCAIAANLVAAAPSFRRGRPTRWMQFAAPTFDASVAEVFMTLFVGGTLCACDRRLMLGAPEAALTEMAADSTMSTPSVIALLDARALHSLRHMWSIGEALNRRVIDAFAGASWDAPMSLINMYGPTEATINVTLDLTPPTQRGSVIGAPMATCSIVILATDGLTPVPAGFPGELALGGPQLSPGYLYRPEQNAKSFVHVPPFGRLYRTGDGARLVEGPDGTLAIEFLGRLSSEQVKIAGRRIELGEIEAAIATPAVAEAAVVHVAPRSGAASKQLVALVVPKDAAGDAAQLARECWDSAARQLQPHMMPSRLYLVQRLPRSVSGKMDRKAIQQMCLAPDEAGMLPLERKAHASEHHDSGSGVDAESTPLFEQLVDVLSTVVAVNASDVTSSSVLAEIGFDSLHAVAFLQQARQAGLSGIEFAHLLTSRTVGDLVAKVRHAATATASDGVESDWQRAADAFDQQWRPLVEAARGSTVQAVAPTTAMQDGVLAESFRDPHLYWVTWAWSLSDAVHLGRLRQAWECVSSTHDMFRVGFVSPASLDASADAAPVFIQVVHGSGEANWVEAAPAPESTNLQAAVDELRRQIATKHHAADFALPPWQVTILTLGERRFMVLHMHHALFDGEMLDHTASDLAEAYAHPDRFVSARCQVVEAAARLLVGRDAARAANFWREQLRDFADAPSPAAHADKAAHGPLGHPPVHRTMDIVSSVSRSRLLRGEGSSLGPLVRVAYGAMLAERAETDRILLAEVRTERLLDARLVDAMAPLVSVYPVPLLARGSPARLVQAQAELSAKSFEHGPVHARELRSIMHHRSDEPLYPAALVIEPISAAAAGADALWQEVDAGPFLHVDHPYALKVSETARDDVLLSLSVDETVMSAAAQDLFLRQLDALLDAMLRHPESPSMARLVEHFPPELVSVSAGVMPDECLQPAIRPGHYVEKHAAEHPEWKAVEAVDSIDPDSITTSCWTYRQLNDNSNRVAHLLRCSGVTEGAVVAVSMARTLWTYAILVGIWKAGSTYVPVEADLPAARKAFILRDSGARVLFASPDSNLLASPPPFPLETLDRVVLVDAAFPGLVADQPSSNPSPLDQGALDADAYLLYTSGSTGTPKGVRVSQANVGAFAEAQSHFICSDTVAPATRRLAGTGKYLSLASMAFDVHIGEAVLAWRHGLSLVTGERMALLDNLGRALRELRVTHASFVPSLLDQTGLVPSDAPDLVFLGVGGEKMTPRTQAVWAGHDRVSLVNAYGPTEVTIGCCSGRLLPDSDTRCIGRPLGTTTARVLVPDAEMLVKRGVPGELVLSGPLVANGYHGAVSSSSFCVIDGQPAYRTGDIVRMEPDGSILFLGRRDDQVKVRGQRLELGEVSQAVRRCASEQQQQQPLHDNGLGANIDAVSLLLKHPAVARQLLVCFVAPGGVLARSRCEFRRELFPRVSDELRAACQASLPAYMVPDVVLPVSSLPLTETSAKADNRQLHGIFRDIPLDVLFGASGAHQDSQGSQSTAKTQAQRKLNSKEARIVSAIASVVPPSTVVTPQTSMLQLGVDSIASLSISFKLRKMGFDSSIAQLLRNQTVEQLAAGLAMSTAASAQEAEARVAAAREHISTLQAAVLEQMASSETSSPAAADVEAVWPCLPLQEVLVAHSLGASPGNDGSQQHYVNHMLFELGPDTDMDRLRRAWELTIAKTDALRTCFRYHDDHIVQLVLRPGVGDESFWTQVSTNHLESPLQTLKGLRPSISGALIAGLQSATPLKLTLVVESPEPRQPPALMLSIHHTLYDAQSLEMLCADVEVAYAQGTAPPQPSIAPYMEHATSQRLRFDDAMKFWNSTFSGLSAPEFSLPGVPGEAKLAQRTLGARLSRLQEQCAALDFGLPSLMQALFAYVLAQSSNRDRVTFGVVLSGRSVDVPGADELRAPCIATIPQLLDLRSSSGSNKEGCSLAEIVRAVQKQLQDSMEFQCTSLADISTWLAVSGPLFSAIFSYVRTSGPGEAAGSGSGGASDKALAYVEGSMALEYALAVECEANVADDGLTLRARSTLPGALADLPSMLEKVELLASALLRGEDLAVAPVRNQVYGPLDLSGDTAGDGDDDDGEWSQLEHQIRSSIVEFCGVSIDNIGKKTPFTRFGIDSITTIRFSKLLRAQGLEVSGADVVRNPSVAALSRHLQHTAEAVPAIDIDGSNSGPRWETDMLQGIVAPGVLDGIASVFPLTSLQAGMLTATLTLDPRLYSHHHAVRMPRNTDTERLRRAWHNLLRRHDILRTSFYAPQEQLETWIGAVHEAPILRWQELEASNASAWVRELDEWTEYKEQASFARPSAQGTVIVTPTELVFVASLHHAMYDGTSIGFIFEDLWALYESREPPRRQHFNDAARAIWAASPASTAFWTAHVSDYRCAELPQSSAEEKEDGAKPSTASVCIASDTPRLGEWCAATGISVQSLFLLALGKALCTLVGARDVVVGHVLAARISLEGADEVAGPMLNTLPLRLRIDDTTASNLDYLRWLQTLQNQSLDHQHASLAEIQSRWRSAGGGNQDKDLFDTLFVFERQQQGAFITAECPWKPLESEPGIGNTLPLLAHYRLVTEAEQRADGSLVINAASRLSQSQLDNLVELVAQCFADVAAAPDRLAVAFPDGLSELPLTRRNVKVARPRQDDAGFRQDALQRFFGPISRVLADVSGTASDHGSVTPQTSIYALGIDSIMAIRVANTCRQAGIPLTTIDIIRNPEVGRLCEVAQAKSGTPQSKGRDQVQPRLQPREESSIPVELVPKDVADAALLRLGIDASATEDVLPTLAGQETNLALWLESGKTLYEPTWLFRSSEPLDDSRLRVAWRELKRRFQVLRSCYVAVASDQVIQVVLDAAKADGNDDDLTILSVAAEDDSTLEQTVRKCLLETYRTPSSLYRPPVRLCLVRGRQDGDAVLLTLNHATYDGWSMPLMIRELCALYEHPDGVAKPLPSFSQFVRETHPYSRGEEEARLFWRESLGSCDRTIVRSPRHYPDGYVDVKPQTPQRAFIALECPAIDIAQLGAVGRRVGVSPHAILVAAYGRALSSVTGTSMPVFGYYSSGRSAAFDQVELVAGPTVNVTPLAIPPPGPNMASNLQRLQGIMASRTDFEQSRLRDILRWIGQDDSPSSIPSSSASSSSASFTVPLFNTFLNIVWSDDMLMQTAGDKQLLLQHWPLGVPSDFASAQAIPAESAVDDLDISFLPSDAVFVDIGPAPGSSMVKMAAKYGGGAHGGEVVMQLLQLFRDGIADVLSSLASGSE